MKKIVSIILLSTILLSGNIAFAQGSTLSTAKSTLAQTRADYKAKLAETSPLLETIRINRVKILSQKAEAKDSYIKAKSHIKELLKNKDNVTPAQIESLKVALNVIQKDKQSLANTIGEIQKETLNLRVAKSEKNFAEVAHSLNSMIAEQNLRIEDLQTIITNLDKASTL